MPSFILNGQEVSFTQTAEDWAKIKQEKVEKNGKRKSILGGGNSLSKDSEAGICLECTKSNKGANMAGMK